MSAATQESEFKYVGIWPFRRKVRKIFGLWETAHMWAKEQDNYVPNMTFKQYRLWMNKKLGTKVSGTDGLEPGAQKWLDAIADLDKQH